MTPRVLIRFLVLAGALVLGAPGTHGPVSREARGQVAQLRSHSEPLARTNARLQLSEHLNLLVVKTLFAPAAQAAIAFNCSTVFALATAQPHTPVAATLAALPHSRAPPVLS